MFSVAILDLMNPNQVNQMNPMQQHQMNQHMMSMQQQQQNFMNQNQMMNPMQQFNQSAQYSQPQAQHQQQHAVLLVSNLDPEVSNSKKKIFNHWFQKITCYDLFILFGVYGNVLRVKVLYNKKDNALLQMSDGQQAETG